MLTGLIWLVQLVHYPGFLLVGKDSEASYQRHHTRSISWVVIPLMLTELVFALWLLSIPFLFQVLSYLSYAAFACLVLIWLVTFTGAVPLHRKLQEQGYEREVIQKLLKLNWIRTVGWTFRTLLLFLLTLFYL